MNKNPKINTMKLNPQPPQQHPDSYDRNRKKLSSNNLSGKIYNNIYLSPNKNTNVNYQEEDRKNYRINTNSNNVVLTEESKHEYRSNSYNKMKPSIFYFFNYFIFSISYFKC